MSHWFWVAVIAALLYGLHQVFTRLAADRIGDGVGGFIVEASAAVSILGYLASLKATHNWTQPITSAGITWSLLAGVCVGAGTIAFREPVTRERVVGIDLSIAGLYLLRK